MAKKTKPKPKSDVPTPVRPARPARPIDETPRGPGPMKRPRLPKPPMTSTELAPMGELEGPDGMGMIPMGPTTEQSIAEWIASRVLPRNIPGVTFQLRQKSIDGENIARAWDPDEVEEQDPASIAAMIYGQAVEDAQDATGVSRYVAYALKPNGDVLSRCFFRIAQEDVGAGYDSEPGHLVEGHLAQAHRHSEAFARMLVGQTEGILRHYRDQNKELAAQAGRAVKLQVEVAELFQKIQDRGMYRDIMLKRIERKEKMTEKVVDYALAFMPDVLSRVGIIPGSLRDTVSNAQTLEGVLSELTPDQVARVMAELPAEKRPTFEKAFVAAKERAARKAAHDAALAARQTARSGTAVTGVPHPAAMSAGSPAASGQPAPIGFTEEELKTLRKTVIALLSTLANLDDASFTFVLGKIPKSAHDDVKRIRVEAIDRTQNESNTAIDGGLIQTFQAVVIHLLATLSDFELTVVLGQVPTDYRETVTAMREIVRARKAA